MTQATAAAHLKYDYKVVHPTRPAVVGCRNGFLNFFGIGRTKFHDLKNAVLKSQYTVDPRSDHTSAKSGADDATIKEIAKDVRAMGRTLTETMKGDIRTMDLTHRAGVAYAWLEQYLSEVADEQPNAHGHKHFDSSRSWKDIHGEYKKAMKERGELTAPVSATRFKSLVKVSAFICLA